MAERTVETDEFQTPSSFEAHLRQRDDVVGVWSRQAQDGKGRDVYYQKSDQTACRVTFDEKGAASVVGGSIEFRRRNFSHPSREMVFVPTGESRDSGDNLGGHEF